VVQRLVPPCLYLQKIFTDSSFIIRIETDQRSDLVTDLPEMIDMRNSTIKMKNKILAIEVAPAAMPPKPNTAATIATTKKMTVQRNIISDFNN
jgi:hypothetical protein